MKTLGLLVVGAVLAAGADSAAEKAVLKAANDLAQAQMKKDKAGMEKLLGDELIYSHSSGMVETKEQHIAASMRPNTQYEKIEYKDTRIMVYGNTAVFTCKALFATNNGGKKADNHLTMLQTWVKRGGGWQLVARWTTRVTPAS
ncbi:MAG: nuclear transport factor 2 family protein [Bryobacteraceae bacterium]|nr:nuclear transport factor 2 family protein [Bryobacteraceae bacterium]